MICFSLWFWLWCAFYNRPLKKHIILLSKCTSWLADKRIHIKLVSSDLISTDFSAERFMLCGVKTFCLNLSKDQCQNIIRWLGEANIFYYWQSTNGFSTLRITRGAEDIYMMNVNLKEPGYFDPSHSRGGWRIPPSPLRSRKPIDETSSVWYYDPSESIGTKKIQNIPCMTSQWRHKWRHVKNTKITKNRQNHGFSLFFQAKVAFFSNDVCQSMLTHVLTPNKLNK